MAGDPENSETLTSWKGIAAYLGVDVRTAQRWESERGLPVRRLSGERSRVFAEPAELDRWRVAQGKQGWWSSLHFLRWYGVATTVVLIAGLAAFLGSYLHGMWKGPPDHFRMEGQDLVMMDRNGRELWRHRFLEVSYTDSYAEAVRKGKIWFGDVNGDSRTEALYAYEPHSRTTAGTTLYCFSSDGKVKWSFQPGRKVANAEKEFSASYLINAFRVLPGTTAGSPKVVVSSSHAWSYPDQVAVLDSNGELRGEYWHCGRLPLMAARDLDGDGQEEVLLAGVDNGRRQATLVVLDPRHVSGASVEDPGDPLQLQGFPAGTEKAVVLFPRSCISQKLQQFNHAYDLQVSGDAIRVFVTEGADPIRPAYIVYSLDRNLNLIGVDISTNFRSLHKELEAARELDHSLSEREIGRLRELRVLRPTP